MGMFTDTLGIIGSLDTSGPGGQVKFQVRERPESDPTGRTAKDPGAKLDNGKIMGGLLADFSLALTAVAEVGTYGANKYTRCGWESVPNGIQRYGDAKWRHLLKGATQPIDQESGLMHKAHEAWNVLAELELMLRENANAAQVL